MAHTVFFIHLLTVQLHLHLEHKQQPTQYTIERENRKCAAFGRRMSANKNRISSNLIALKRKTERHTDKKRAVFAFNFSTDNIWYMKGKLEIIIGRAKATTTKRNQTDCWHLIFKCIFLKYKSRFCHFIYIQFRFYLLFCCYYYYYYYVLLLFLL